MNTLKTIGLTALITASAGCSALFGEKQEVESPIVEYTLPLIGFEGFDGHMYTILRTSDGAAASIRGAQMENSHVCYHAKGKEKYCSGALHVFPMTNGMEYQAYMAAKELEGLRQNMFKTEQAARAKQ